MAPTAFFLASSLLPGEASESKHGQHILSQQVAALQVPWKVQQSPTHLLLPGWGVYIDPNPGIPEKGQQARLGCPGQAIFTHQGLTVA